MSRFPARLSAAIVVVTVGAWAAPPGAGKRVITLHDSVVPGRPGRSELRVVYGMRSSLTRCAALRSPEEKAATATASYRLVLTPNGEVGSATVTMDGPAPPTVRACVQDTVSRVIFDPPGGGGATLVGAIVFPGTGPTNTPESVEPEPPLAAFPRGQKGPSRALPTLTLPSVAEPREGHAVDAAVRAARRCVDAEAVATIDVTMLVGPDGTLFEASVAKGAGASDALIACVREGLKTGGEPPSVTDVTVTLRLEKGGVHVER